MTESAAKLYKRATFVTHLPAGHLYSPTHCWMGKVEGSSGLWRVGFSKFALRMLGELVDVQFDAKPGGKVGSGDVLGSIEGFKALSDIYCVGVGTFVRANPELQTAIAKIAKDPYKGGWLYEFEGEPDSRCLDLKGYEDLLDSTIDRILAKQKHDEAAA